MFPVVTVRTAIDFETLVDSLDHAVRVAQRHGLSDKDVRTTVVEDAIAAYDGRLAHVFQKQNDVAEALRYMYEPDRLAYLRHLDDSVLDRELIQGVFDFKEEQYVFNFEAEL